MFLMRDENEDDNTKKVTPTLQKEFKAYVRFPDDDDDANNAEFGRNTSQHVGGLYRWLTCDTCGRSFVRAFRRGVVLCNV